MGITNKAIIQLSESSILAIIKEFQSGPFRFMFESDIQFSLASKMRGAIPETKKVVGTGHPFTEYELAIVNTEYGSRVDVSCLDVEEKNNIPDASPHKGNDTFIYAQALLVGIEIKYLKLGDKFGFQKCIDDYNKLTNLKVPHSYVLGFIQNEKDVDLFFSGDVSKYLRTQVEFDDLEVLSDIIIVSPEKIWKVEVKKHG